MKDQRVKSAKGRVLTWRRSSEQGGGEVRSAVWPWPWDVLCAFLGNVGDKGQHSCGVISSDYVGETGRGRKRTGRGVLARPRVGILVALRNATDLFGGGKTGLEFCSDE